MRAMGLASAGTSALLLCLLASASSAQDASRQRAPIVRVYSQDGGGVVSNYVTPAIDVSEDAYVFAVMMDLDGRIQVLQPEFPGISVRIRSHKQLRLPNFFAGFNAPMQGAQHYTRNGLVSNDRYDALGNDTRGTVIALASRAPFNLELIEANGDWNISGIRQLIERRSPVSAAQSLAQYLGARGEPIGHDYMRFAGQRQSYYAYNDLGYCGYGGYGAQRGAFYSAEAFAQVAQLRSLGLRPVVVGYDSCGLPLIVVAPFAKGGGFLLPPSRPPRGDTTVFPKSHFPQGIARHPVPEGIFPLPQRAETQMRDATVPAPQGRRAEPREIRDQFRSSEPDSYSLPERARRPVESTIPARAQPAATGTQPVYRPEPRVIERAEPTRMPERIREAAPAPAPTPVLHQRPVDPSPPPPRMHVEPQSRPAPPPPPPSSKTEPAPVPPPRR